MPAPKKPNTAAATAAVRRRGQETMAEKLRAAGWTVIPPEEVNQASIHTAHGSTSAGACRDTT
jgi:hypothetical protein